ncbi:hypothetical protein [Sporosarcina sp. E16_3]|nr:hypothetical protein [Sporosarcina sp. E16_3]
MSSWLVREVMANVVDFMEPAGEFMARPRSQENGDNSQERTRTP